jgi:hypothetical protein
MHIVIVSGASALIAGVLVRAAPVTQLLSVHLPADYVFLPKQL